MDKFTEYLLSKINEYGEDAKNEPSEKDICDAVRGELLEALVEYKKSMQVGVA